VRVHLLALSHMLINLPVCLWSLQPLSLTFCTVKALPDVSPLIPQTNLQPDGPSLLQGFVVERRENCLTERSQCSGMPSMLQSRR
jgi:hypothetical protein